jgi:hypothetical protein
VDKAKASEAKQKVAERFEAMLSRRPGASLVADKVVRRIVEVYGERPPTADQLVSRRKVLEDILRADIPDLTVQRGFRKPASRDGDRTSAGLMIYEPRAVEQDGRVFLGAYNYTIILKPSKAWIVSSIEPAVTQPHLFQRIIERSSMTIESFAEVQARLSDVWFTLLWMRSRRVLSRRGFIPHEFMTPWEDGLLFGKVEKLEGLAEGAAAPLVYVVRTGPPERHYLPDFYAEGPNRVNVFTHTFVGPGELRPHQIVLRDELTRFVSSNRKVIEHLKLTWKIAADSDNPFTHEIMKVFRFDHPTSTELSKALSELDAIVDSEDWRNEAAFSARSQSRHQADAIGRRSTSSTN